MKELNKDTQLLNVLLDRDKSGIMIAEKCSEKIIYANSIADELLEAKLLYRHLNDFFDSEQLRHLNERKKVFFEKEFGKLEISSVCTSNYYVVFLDNMTSIDTMKEESIALRRLNRKLQAVYENYTEDTIFITDAEGNVIYSGEACERQCGINAKDIVGMNIFDLEKSKHFYPSVTIKVLKSRKMEVVEQSTKIGVDLITIGMPIFDEKGDIKNVISISRDFSKEFEIAALLLEAQKDIHEEDIGEHATHDGESHIVSCSSKIYNIISLMRMVSPTNASVILTGETGTGKGIFAKYIHAKSKRSTNSFIHVNCGAIAENLFETELFGYEKNTFTGADKEGRQGLIEMANGGTLFLDEIGELPLAHQVKLLHVIQEKKLLRVGGRKHIDLDIRIVTATNKNIEKMVEKGLFREDLYYRLNVVSIHVPSLKDRQEDIPLLIKHFMNVMNEKNRCNKEISNKAIESLAKYHWPGNVRELENLIEMLHTTVAETIIENKHLPAKILRSDNHSTELAAVQVSKILPLKNALAETEQKLLKLALEENEGNQQIVADVLKIDRSTVTRKINQYSIEYKKT